MKRYLLLVGLLVMLWGTEVKAATIGFDGLMGKESFITYIECEFTVSNIGGNWLTSQSLGNPSPSIYAVVPSMGGAGISVTRRDDQDFSFQGVHLSGSGTEYIIQGLDDESEHVFSFDYIGTGSGFESIVARDFIPGNPSIRTLTIYGSRTHAGQISIDNICLDGASCPVVFATPPPGGGGNVPEPASLLILGAGLAGIGIWRRKPTKI